jgi:hypothetical protein
MLQALEIVECAGVYTKSDDQIFVQGAYSLGLGRSLNRRTGQLGELRRDPE